MIAILFASLLIASAPAAAEHACEATVAPGESVQDALDATDAGDRVCLEGGQHAEALTVSTSEVTLRNHTGSDHPVIDGENARETGLQVQAPNVTLEGINVTAHTGDGIHVHAADVTVREVLAGQNGGAGIVADHSDALLLEDVTSDANNQHGVSVSQSQGVKLFDVKATNNGQDGIRLGSTGPVGQATLDGVEASLNALAGLKANATDELTVTSSSFQDNGGPGGHLSDTGGATLQTLVVSRNDHGLRLDNATGVHVKDTTTKDNDAHGLLASDVQDSIVETSLFEGNGEDGIRMDGSSTNNTLTTTETASNDGWGVTLLDGGSLTAQQVLIGDSPKPDTAVSFKARNVSLQGNATTPPDHGDAYTIERGFDATEHAPDAYLDIELHYLDGDVQGLAETTLSLWRLSDGTWEKTNATADPLTNAIQGNLTAFSTFGAHATAKQGTLNGTLANAETNEPIPNATVNVLNLDTETGDATTSNQTGGYELALDPGTYGIDISADDHGNTWKIGVEVTSNNTTTLDFDLAPVHALTVNVTTEDGAPIESANVEAFDDGLNHYDTNQTNATGTSLLNVPTSTYTVTADADGYAPRHERSVDVDANTSPTVSISLAKPAFINGTVTDDQGDPVQGAMVLADDGERFAFDQTNATGHYGLEMAEGTYRVLAFHDPDPSDPSSTQSFARADQDFDLSTGENATADLELSSPSVEDSTIRILEGPGDASNLTVGVNMIQGLLGIQPYDPSDPEATPGMPYDLTKIGADASTLFEINMTLTGYEPSSLMWAGANTTWSTETNATDPNATDVRIEVSPVHLAGIEEPGIPVGPMMNQNPETVDWPTSTDDQAEESLDWENTVYLGLFDLSTLPSEQANLLGNMTVTTNAQAFTVPQVQEGELEIWVGGPSRTSDGSDHDGFYTAFIPDAQLDDWGVSDPAQELEVLYKGANEAFDVNATEDGAWITLDIEYSAGSLSVKAAAAPTTNEDDDDENGGGGGGGSTSDDGSDPTSVASGEKLTTRTDASFTAEPGALVTVDEDLPAIAKEISLEFDASCSACKVTAASSPTRPSQISPLDAGFDESTYLTLEIQDAEDTVQDALTEAEIAFTVPQEDLAAADPDQVVLLRYDDGWDPLDTHLDSDDLQADPLPFKASTPGFSTFAVATDTDEPTVEDEHPTENVTTTTPEISAHIGDNRGVDEETLELVLDGEEVPSGDEARLVEGNEVTFTPEQPLREGLHNVTLRMQDASGLDTSRSWSFIVAPSCPASPDVEKTQPQDGETGLEPGTPVVVSLGFETATCQVSSWRVSVDGSVVTSTLEEDALHASLPETLGANQTVPLSTSFTTANGAEGSHSWLVTTAPGEEQADHGEPAEEAPGPGLVVLLVAIVAIAGLRGKGS